MKIGDEITMFFHGCGVTSLVQCKIMSFDDKTVTIDDTEDGRIFNRKNGKCLNDNTFGGFSRTIEPCPNIEIKQDKGFKNMDEILSTTREEILKNLKRK